MAVIKAVNSQASIGKAINYVTKEEKSEEKLISGQNCNPKTAIDEMKATKEEWNKTTGRQYKHYIQSFDPKEKVTPEKAHEIASEWAEKNFKGHEVLIATHKDREHIHSHFIVNSVNFENGKKYHQSKQDLKDLKHQSDLICEREGLEVIKGKSKEITSFDQRKYKSLEKGIKGDTKSYVFETAKDVSKSLKESKSPKEFIKDMESKGYKVLWKDTRKYVTFTTPEGKKVRNSNLEKTFKEEKFSKEGMLNELQRNRERGRTTEPTERNVARIDRTIKGKSGTKQADGKLHKSSSERGNDRGNESRSTAIEDGKDKRQNSKSDGIDFERAKERAGELLQDVNDAFGNWKERDEEEQSGNSKRTRGTSKGFKNTNERDVDQYKKLIKRNRTYERGFDR